eukprot:11195895-Alexandrium_andersonii.AAC.1
MLQWSSTLTCYAPRAAVQLPCKDMSADVSSKLDLALELRRRGRAPRDSRLEPFQPGGGRRFESGVQRRAEKYFEAARSS